MNIQCKFCKRNFRKESQIKLTCCENSFHDYCIQCLQICLISFFSFVIKNYLFNKFSYN